MMIIIMQQVRCRRGQEGERWAPQVGDGWPTVRSSEQSPPVAGHDDQDDDQEEGEDGSGVDNDQVLFSNIDLRRINNLPSPLPLGPSFDRCLDLIFSGWYPEIMTLFQGGPERANLYGHLLKSLRILSGYDVCLASLWARQGRPGWLFMEQWHQVGFSPATVTIHVGSLTC